MTAQYLSPGMRVSGAYFGTAFSGVIKDKTVINQFKVAYHVILEREIVNQFDMPVSGIWVEQDVREDMSELSERHWIDETKETENE